MSVSAAPISAAAGRRAVPWRAVGFDLDGTLFDHQGAATSAVEQLMTDLGHETTPARVAAWFEIEARHFERWRAGDISFVEQRRLRLGDFLKVLGVEPPTSVEHADALFGGYLVNYRRAWRAFPGVVSFLTSLRASDVRIGILTNGNHAQQVDKIDVIGLTPLIDVVCTSDQIGVAKPDRRAFESLAARLECAMPEMAFVGDHVEVDIAGARAAGIAAGRVVHGGASRVTLEAALEGASL